MMDTIICISNIFLSQWRWSVQNIPAVYQSVKKASQWEPLSEVNPGAGRLGLPKALISNLTRKGGIYGEMTKKAVFKVKGSVCMHVCVCVCVWGRGSLFV